MNDTVNSRLLGMIKVVSQNSARRALPKIDPKKGANWLKKHLHSTYEPLLETPWILDVDVTIKPTYAHQEEAVIGYNSKKPGRPCHTYMMANIRLVLDVVIQSGNQGSSSHSLPGLMALLQHLPKTSRPKFIHGDCDWGTEQTMLSLEKEDYHYLFKMKKSKKCQKVNLQSSR